MTFSQELKIAIDNVNEQANKAYKETLRTTFRLVIQGTPIRDGYAIGGWQMINADKNPGNQTNRQGADLSEIARIPDLGGAVMLYNNVPYIERLEDGYSEQKPSGWVRSLVRQIPQRFKVNYEQG